LNAAREARQAAKDKASIRQADARIKIAREKLRLQRQADSGKGSAAQKAETKLALDILRDPDAIIGKPGKYPTDPRVGAKSYAEAYDYVYALADAAMPNRKPPYINAWVKKQLRALGIGKVDPKPRGG
jgi:hypothetical protein